MTENAMIDRRPAAVARCSGPADVRAAVRFAADQGIYPAIRGGGHNVAGPAMVDDGLVVDLTRMKGIYVDPVGCTATAQMGLTWGEFDRETQLYGLATTGGLISATGTAGLTLGGGVGWLMGRCGLVCDNTLSYDIVLASGELTRATIVPADGPVEVFVIDHVEKPVRSNNSCGASQSRFSIARDSRFPMQRFSRTTPRGPMYTLVLNRRTRRAA